MNRLLIVSALLFSLCTGCSTMYIYTDVDKSANFKNYKKYAWSPQKHIHKHKNQKFDNDIIEKRIQQYVMDELNNRGLKLDTANPDIILDFDIMTEKKIKQDMEPVYINSPFYFRGFNNYNSYRYRDSFYNYGGWNNYYNYGYGYHIGYRSVNIPYKEGTVIIDIVDADANKLVWKGYAVGELVDPETFESGLQLDIHKMFKEYPNKSKK
jgi:hypothetical protein